jgi:tyrosine-protein phosphatase SIW14
MDRRQVLLGIAALLPSAPSGARPAAWARPIELPGVPNLHRVTARLYRSGQPTAEGFSRLERQLHIRTVVNLHDEGPDEAIAPPGHLKFVHIPINSFRVFSNHEEKLVLALHEIRRGLRRGKVLVHCTYGKDRTGAVMAAWRMVEQNWSADRAIREMNEGGFGYSAWLFSNSRHLRSLDVEALRRRLDRM